MKYLLLLLISFNVFAYKEEVFEVPSFSIDINTENVISKINSAVNNPEGILKRYTPVGGTYKNKVVKNNEVSFVMTKRVLIITKTFNVHFILDIHQVDKICPKNQLGFSYKVDLTGSDSLVLDNIDRLEFNICIKENSNNSATANVTGHLVKGANYGEPIGSIAKNTIEDQVDPFVKAIKEEVQNSLY